MLEQSEQSEQSEQTFRQAAQGHTSWPLTPQLRESGDTDILGPDAEREPRDILFDRTPVFRAFVPSIHHDSGFRCDANVRRLLALWQACEGLSTEVLEAAAAHYESGAITAVLGVIRRIWGLRDAETQDDLRELTRNWALLAPALSALGAFPPVGEAAAPPESSALARRDAAEGLYIACRIAEQSLRQEAQDDSFVWSICASALARADQRDFRPSVERGEEAFYRAWHAAETDEERAALDAGGFAPLIAAIETRLLDREASLRAVVQCLVAGSKKPMLMDERVTFLKYLAKLGEEALAVGAATEEGTD